MSGTGSACNFTHDVIVIGGGPAGMSAALTVAEHGGRVALLDEQPRPGGQIYRNVTRASAALRTLLGPDYQYGARLAERLLHSRVECRFETSVWDVGHDLTLTAHAHGQSTRLRAPQLIAATGAMERPSPIPGWTLPGVLNAGAAQILLKNSATIPSGAIVLVGGGPLLLLVACQLLDAGARVSALVETTPASNWLKALPYLSQALLTPSYLAKGAGLLLKLKRAGIAFHRNATDVRIEGNNRVSAISFRSKGAAFSIAAEIILLHHGVIPNTQLSRLLRVEHRWDDIQTCWAPQVDQWYETSLRGLRIPGDGASITGALAAEASGALAAIGALHAIERIDSATQQRLAHPWRTRLQQQMRVRRFLDELYRPPQWLATPTDETIVCRCEEVDAGTIRRMAELGCKGPNQTKFFSRCGMGPCQGRQCAITVSQMLAHAHSLPVQEIGSYRIRPPLKPVPLGSIAALSHSAPSTPVLEDTPE